MVQSSPSSSQANGREERQNNQGGRKPWSFMTPLLFITVLFLVNNWGSRNAQVRHMPPGSKRATESGNKVSGLPTTPPGAFMPIAKQGDRIDIFLEANPPIFPPYHFSNLPFDFGALQDASPFVTLSANLSNCVAVNCTADLRVAWSIRNYSFFSTVPLVRFYAENRRPSKYLFGNATEEAFPTDTLDGSYRAYFQPKVTLNPVVSFDAPLPEPYLAFTPIVDDKPGYYGPAVFINNFWVLREHYVELNESSASHLWNFTVEIVPASSMKVLLYVQLDASFAAQAESNLIDSSAVNQVKKMLLDASTKNPYFLALTAAVTVLHMVFESLALTYDVQFWKGRRDFRGLSLRTILLNCYCQTVVFLYLLESHETSWMVLVPSGIGMLTEYWKMTLAIKISKAKDDSEEATGEKMDTKVSGLRIAGYIFHFNESCDTRTQKYDNTAVRCLIISMIPLLIGYSAYSAVYNTHRSWYSFFIRTQVRFTYFFGFALMTPQIFINYKLKSVGQLPWRTFVFKALNTVIDDLFAFVITMPWLHRLACFRDDVVFAILLFQRWIYPVDMSRFDGEDGEVCMSSTGRECDLSVPNEIEKKNS